MNWGIKYRPQRGPFVGFDLVYQVSYGLPVLFATRSAALLKCNELTSIGDREYPLYPEPMPCTETEAMMLAKRVVEFYSGYLIIREYEEDNRKQLAFVPNHKPPKKPRLEHATYEDLLPELQRVANQVKQVKSKAFSIS